MTDFFQFLPINQHFSPQLHFSPTNQQTQEFSTTYVQNIINAQFASVQKNLSQRNSFIAAVVLLASSPLKSTYSAVHGRKAISLLVLMTDSRCCFAIMSCFWFLFH
jgi:hypothetical protein